MTVTASRSKLIRRNRRFGIVMLGLSALLVAVSILTGEGLSASNWMSLSFMVLMGLGMVSTERLMRIGPRDAAGVERQERRFEAAAIVLGVGLPLVALVAVLVLVVVILVR